jgi:hypothetical protein
MEGIFAFIRSNPSLLLFAALAGGYALAKVKVKGFTFNDWKDMRYPEGFIKYFIKKMKKRGVTKVIVELYDAGGSTHEKLTVFKKMKFRTDTTGNMTVYQSWLLIRDL